MPTVNGKKYPYTTAGKLAAKKAGAKKPGAKKAGTVVKKKQKTAAERGSSPVQERDTGPGVMTATGSKTRRTKRALPKAKTTSRERASRPVTSENTNTLRVQKAKKKKK
jgi:hypothetical protein